MVVWLAVVVLIYAAWCALLYVKQDSMMFPRHLTGPAAAGPPPGVRSLWVGAGDEGVEGWLVPPPVAGGPAPLLVFFHGNGELIDHNLGLAEAWRERGYAVLLPEYRGYGRSGGRPSQGGIVDDAVRLLDLAAATPGIDATRVVLHGRSLGGAVAAQVAARLSERQARGTAGGRPRAERPRAVIAESCFPSAAAFAARFLAPPALVRNPFRTGEALRRFGGPALILHGRDDRIVPASMGRRLHERVPGSVYLELAGGHNDFPEEPAFYWRAMDEFLGRLPP